MQPDILDVRSPMQAVSAIIRGGLSPGQVGAVFARAGVGKSAFLVHVALNQALKGADVLHVSLNDRQPRVRAFYDEILAEVSHAAGLKNPTKAMLDAERHCVIHACLGCAFGPDQLRERLASLAELMDFQPTVVVVDGLDHSEVRVDEWRALAAEANVRIWLAVRVHRKDGPAPAELAGAYDTAVALVPDGKDVVLQVLRAGGSVVDTRAMRLDPVTMLVHAEDAAVSGGTSASPHPETCTLYSGGASGAEAAFGQAAERHGVKEVSFSFVGHTQARTVGRVELSERDLAAGDVSLVYVAHKLHRNWKNKKLIQKVLQSQWHVVSHARQVFVVGRIQPDGTVQGGTGWAVELAKRWHKGVWVYDQEVQRWYTWTDQGWVENAPVISSASIAATGTRFLNDAGRAAIDDLFDRSFGA